MTGRSWRELIQSGCSGQVVAARDHVLIGKERNDVGRPRYWGYPICGIVTPDYLVLRNYEPTRWPAGNPETGYLDTDGSPTKTVILELGRRDRSARYWQLNFGMRPAVELYDLRRDPDCVDNLADQPRQARVLRRLEARMVAELKAQGDPRMFGRGAEFDAYPYAFPPGWPEDHRGFFTNASCAGKNTTRVGLTKLILNRPPIPRVEGCDLPHGGLLWGTAA